MKEKKYEEKYKQIREMVEWVEAHSTEIAREGMNIIMAIADEEKIRAMGMTGKAMPLAIMLEVLTKSGAETFDEVYGCETLN